MVTPISDNDMADTQRTLLVGKPSDIGTNNAVFTSKYTMWTFLPLVSLVVCSWFRDMSILMVKKNLLETQNCFFLHLFTHSARFYILFQSIQKAVREQFRRNGNLYFLVMGCLMFLGTYTDLFYSSVSPWTTLGPLALVVSISLTQEGVADYVGNGYS